MLQHGAGVRDHPRTRILSQDWRRRHAAVPLPRAEQRCGSSSCPGSAGDFACLWLSGLLRSPVFLQRAWVSRNLGACFVPARATGRRPPAFRHSRLPASRSSHPVSRNPFLTTTGRICCGEKAWSSRHHAFAGQLFGLSSPCCFVPVGRCWRPPSLQSQSLHKRPGRDFGCWGRGGVVVCVLASHHRSPSCRGALQGGGLLAPRPSRPFELFCCNTNGADRIGWQAGRVARSRGELQDVPFGGTNGERKAVAIPKISALGLAGLEFGGKVSTLMPAQYGHFRASVLVR